MKYSNIVLYIVGGILLVAGLIIVSRVLEQSSRDITGTLRKYRLLPEQEAITELYFMDHTGLKARMNAGVVATASFTIANRTGQDKRYLFVISSIHRGVRTELATGSADIPTGSLRTVLFEYQVATPEPATTFEVLLPEEKQQVHFTVNSSSKHNAK